MVVTDTPETLATRILHSCLAGDEWDTASLDRLIDTALINRQGTNALFGILVERLGDLFEPRLVTTYVRLFAHVCERALGLNAAELIDRYDRIRPTGRFAGPDPETVVVLSRVTLGADIAVTSVLMDAALRRFPKAEVVFAGPEKNYELFAGHPRIKHLPVSYPRHALLGERLEAWRELRALIDGSTSIVLDPDSRLTQLGLLPVIDEERYFFFESRAYGGWSQDSLPQLAASWCREALSVLEARPFLCPADQGESITQRTITVSLGVGGNLEKRVADPFEEELLRLLATTGSPLLIDRGAGGEETGRVNRALSTLGGGVDVEVWDGAFAPFAARIANSDLYVGYDSAGQHVAAAASVPLITIFRGYAGDRALHRWSPAGDGPIEVIPVHTDDDAAQVLDTVRSKLDRLRDGRVRRIA